MSDSCAACGQNKRDVNMDTTAEQAALQGASRQFFFFRLVFAGCVALQSFMRKAEVQIPSGSVTAELDRVI